MIAPISLFINMCFAYQDILWLQVQMHTLFFVMKDSDRNQKLLNEGQFINYPISIFTCKYYINGNEKYVSVRNVRVFDDNQTRKTKYQLTDHVNFPRKLVEKYIDICEEELRNKKLMMVCTASKYNHYGVERYALKLVTGYSVSPIIRASTVKSKWLEDLERLKKLRDSYNMDRAIRTDP